MIQPCHQVATHYSPHWDEVVARILFQRYGNQLFPGASSAEVVVWRSGDTPDGRPASAWEAEGVIPIGVGHGRFDEHLPGGGRMLGECSATLVAKALGIYEREELRKLLMFTLKTDEGPAQHSFDVSAALKTIYGCYPDDPYIGEVWATEAVDAIIEPKGVSHINLAELLSMMDITSHKYDKLIRFTRRINTLPEGRVEHPFDIATISRKMPKEQAKRWLKTILVAIRDEQLNFSTSAIEFEQKANIVEVKNGADTPFRIVTVESKNQQIAKFARSKHGCEASVVVRKDPVSGQVQIFTDKRRVRRYLADRIAEAVIAAEPTDGGRWHHHEDAQSVLNGSNSHPDVPPTKLTLHEIQKIIVQVVEAHLTPA